MTFFLGMLSLMMMGVFPGAIILKILKMDKRLNFLLFLLTMFALSLLFNFVLVIALTLMHVYITAVVQDIAALECLCFILLYQGLLDKPIYWRAWIKKSFSLPFTTHRMHYLAALIIVLALINWISSFGHPFGYWDATVSYNRWATDFAHNQMPTLTWHYPQLLPSNWSLTYVLMGPLPEHIFLEIFPASMQGFFFVGILMFFWVLYRLEQNVQFLSGLVLTTLIMYYYFSVYFNTGYADIPVTFFNFAAITLSILGYGVYSKCRRSLTFIALLFIFAAAMTKPAGIYAALVFPALQGMMDQKVQLRSSKIKILFLKYLLLTILIAPWYIYSSIYESNTGHFSDVLFLIKDAGSPMASAGHFFGVLNSAYLVGILGILVIIFRSWIPRPIRLVFYFYIPYFFIWLLFFSYDNRNMMMLCPIVCLACGFVLSHNLLFYKAISSLKMWFLPIRVWVFAVAGAIILAFLCLCFSQNVLLNYQEKQKNFSLNDLPFTIRLYAYKLSPGFQGKILTDYAYFNYLPMLHNNMAAPPLNSYNKNMEPGYFQDLPLFLVYMKAHPEIHYLLLNHNFDGLYESKQFNQSFNLWIKQKKISQQFILDNVGLYKINVPNEALGAPSSQS